MSSLVTLHLHVHAASGDTDRLLNEVIERSKTIMATVEQVKQAVADEASEVKARVDALTAEVQALKDQIAAGTAATPEQLDEILASVKGIFTPA